MIRTISAWILALVCVLMALINAVISYIWLSKYTDPDFYEMLSGADPIIVAYLENALFTIPGLLAVIGLFGLAAWRFIFARTKAATPVLMAVALILATLAVSSWFGMTGLHLNPGELPFVLVSLGLLAGTSFWVSRAGK